MNLTSVLNLQQAIRTKQHKGSHRMGTVESGSVMCRSIYLLDLTELFQNHKFVGCVDQTRALVQHQVHLYNRPEFVTQNYSEATSCEYI